MHEKRPTPSDELEPVSVDTGRLSREMKASLATMLRGELHGLVVDVHSRPTIGPSPEWRLNVPPKMPKLYSAISELASQANAFYEAFIMLGTMEPREFTVNVWCLNNNEAPVKGSFD